MNSAVFETFLDTIEDEEFRNIVAREMSKSIKSKDEQSMADLLNAIINKDARSEFSTSKASPLRKKKQFLRIQNSRTS